MSEYLNQILYILGGRKRKLPLLFLLFLTLSFFELLGIGLIGPYMAMVMNSGADNKFLAYVFNLLAFFSEDKKTSLIITGLFLIFIFGMKTIFGLLVNYTIAKFSQKSRNDLQLRLLCKFTSVNYEDFISVNSAEYIFVMHELTRRYTNQILMPLLKFLGDAVVCMLIFMLLAITTGVYFLYLLLAIGLCLLIFDKSVRTKLSIYGRSADSAEATSIKNMAENFKAYKEIKIFGIQDFFTDRLKSNIEVYSGNFIKSLILSQIPRYLMEFILLVFIILSTIILLILNANITDLIPVLAMYGVAALKVIPMANGFFNLNNQLRYNRQAISKIYRSLQFSNSYATEAIANTGVGEKFKSISLLNVNFSYRTSTDDILKNITITINAGESIAIIGPSGSGKSTLLDVMLGLLSADNGCINFNGRSVKQCEAEWIANVAYLPQQTLIMDDTLRRNIALGLRDNEIDESRVIDALRKAKLDNLVKSLDMNLGENGVMLSGGQIQRVALARAFYLKKDVMILDEITSALDNLTENEISKELSLLKGKKTIIIITHKLSSIKYCDRIYQIDAGRIVKVGRPVDFLRDLE